jgi:hypothetical protein
LPATRSATTVSITGRRAKPGAKLPVDYKQSLTCPPLCPRQLQPLGAVFHQQGAEPKLRSVCRRKMLWTLRFGEYAA